MRIWGRGRRRVECAVEQRQSVGDEEIGANALLVTVLIAASF